MSNKINPPLLQQKQENKKEIPQFHEKENRFLQDIQLLSSIKSIPGKIIPLYNKINEVSKNNNKENDIKQNNKNETNNKIYHNSKSLFTPEKPIINNYKNIRNNIYKTNNFYFNNEINVTNMHFNFNSIANPYDEMGIIPDQIGFLDSPIFKPSSNPQTILSMNSEIKNNFMWTNNKFTQNSFYFQNLKFNGNCGNQNENLFDKDNRNIILNNKKSQLSYYQIDLGKEEFLKKKRSSHLLFRKENDKNPENQNHHIDNNNNNCNFDDNKFEKKSSLLIYNINNDDSKKGIKNIINIDEKKDKKINDIKVKKILFNIENYSEESYDDEEDDNIYHNINYNNLDNNNLFNCYQKKKKRRRKLEIKKFKCLHPICYCSYKTMKQLKNHHYKMTTECQLDTVYILKLISSTKKMLFKLFAKDKSKKKYFCKLYENSINNVSLNNYFESIVGTNIDDIIK